MDENLRGGLDDKYVGLILAIASSFLTGASFILTKKGLMASGNHGWLRYDT